MRTLSLHLFEILSNSVFYGANNIEIIVKDSKKENVYYFEVKDDGRGIRQEDIEKATDAPFRCVWRRVDRHTDDEYRRTL